MVSYQHNNNCNSHNTNCLHISYKTNLYNCFSINATSISMIEVCILIFYFFEGKKGLQLPSGCKAYNL